MKSPGLIVDDDEAEQLWVSIENVLSTVFHVEVFLLVGTEQRVWMHVEQLTGNLEALAADVDGDALVTETGQWLVMDSITRRTLHGNLHWSVGVHPYPSWLLAGSVWRSGW